MMKPSQNGVLLLQLHPYLQKGAKCESGKYRTVSSLGAFFSVFATSGTGEELIL